MKEVKTRMSIGGKDDPNPVPDNNASIEEGRARTSGTTAKSATD